MLEGSLHRQGPGLLQTLIESLDSLRLLGRRSWLAMLGIAVGCAAIVALLNIGQNAANEAMTAFKGMGAETIVASFPFSPLNSRALPPTLDTRLLLKKLPAIAQVAPTTFHSGQVRYAGRTVDAVVLGTTGGLAETLDLKLAQGRFISDFDQQATYIVAGAKVAHKLGIGVPGRPLIAGMQLQIEGYLFEVIGIARPQAPNPLIPIQVDEALFIPIESMRRLQPSPQLSSVIAKVRNGAVITESAQDLRTYLEEVLKGHDVEVLVPQQLIDSLTHQSNTFSYLLAGLGGISLLVGGAGVMNVMLMNVSERRREIGVRMALGARARDIRMLFLLEAACLSVTGSLVGAAVGLLSAFLFVWFSGWRFTLAIESLPLGVGSSLLIGLFFGLYPAVTASRLQPVQALRDD
ncbi:ABC transporter permease [Pseudomonas hefeiensis]|uniref:ABC transporter permease n=1 Tax=Pseudomonas hefeiensis TaxID=2738125 RepID=A0ABY9GGB7_9PSED|nr:MULTISPECIES: ABC transporter permease [unclassified Pseudomonas]WLH14721.1 ABC transporter permease [Pseudomonas sp. FP205]WLH97776.1 ABC transporter permease [Pseudomonas sp. FP53]WLI42048.1 ABC transporter permease [Pseudomonas sp. FP821]